MPPVAMSESLHFPAADSARLEPHLPTEKQLPPPLLLKSPEDPGGGRRQRPFVTLTFATSLDSSLSLAPGTRTRLSGPESKAMTHYLRSRHDAICVGVGTVIADDPGLNCRIEGVGLGDQPRPIIIDPRARWECTSRSKVLEIARSGLGLAPFVITAEEAVVDPVRRAVLEEHGGNYLSLGTATAGGRFRWEEVFLLLLGQGLRSVMVEGGGQIINDLLAPACHSLVDSVIVTIAPTWLGQGGVVVSPERVQDSEGNPVNAARLHDVSWLPFGQDIVLCGRFSPGDGEG